LGVMEQGKQVKGSVSALSAIPSSAERRDQLEAGNIYAHRHSKFYNKTNQFE